MTLSERVGYMFGSLKETLKLDNGWQLVFDRLFFGKGDGLIVYRFGGMEFVVDEHAGDHAGGARTVFGSEEYKQFLRRFDLPESVTVLDLGAHIGSFPLLLTALNRKTGRLVCLEPNPATFQKLEFNIRRNLGAAPLLLNQAVASQTGVVTFWQSGPSVGSSLYKDESSRSLGEVAATTLDAIYQQHFNPGDIDICKLDVEGAEFEILESSTSQRLDRCRYLIIEIHPTAVRSEAKLVKTILSRGFREIPPARRTGSPTHCFENERFAKGAFVG